MISLKLRKKVEERLEKIIGGRLDESFLFWNATHWARNCLVMKKERSRGKMILIELSLRKEREDEEVQDT